MAIVYRAVNKVNGHTYIGFTSKAINVRRNQHHADARRGLKTPLHCAIRKHGEDAFEWEILCESDDTAKLLNEIEPTIIASYRKRLGKGCYNASLGGESGRSGCRPWNKGIPRTLDVKQKLRERQLGRKQSVETVAKRVQKTKGMKRSNKTKTIMSSTWFVETPDGKTLTIINLKQFCIENNLSSPCMIGVADGKRQQHKGYKCVRLKCGSSSRIKKL